jgi:hypothetical protein
VMIFRQPRKRERRVFEEYTQMSADKVRRKISRKDAKWRS